MYNREGAFDIYSKDEPLEIVGYKSCGGCPCGNIEYTPEDMINLWQIDNVKIIAATAQRKNVQSYRNDTETAIIETISGRPCTVDDLTKILGMHINEVNKYLDVLDAENKIEFIEQDRGIFYQIKTQNK